MNIQVGILTSGSPRIVELRGSERSEMMLKHYLPETMPLYRLENLLIGDKFHWEAQRSGIFPGEMRIDPETGQLINELPLEIYLKNVVGSEMNPNSPIEFLRAHAIISRSWAAGKILRLHHEDSSEKIFSEKEICDWNDTADHEGFDVCSDDHCQRYQGLQPISTESLDAIESTSGIVLADEAGEVIDARFSKCCGGHTELFSTCWQNVNPKTLEAFPDPWCDYSTLPHDVKEELLDIIMKDYDRSLGNGYSWSVTVSRKEIRENLRSRFRRDVGEIQSLKPLQRGPSGRIFRLEISGSEGSLILGKELAIRRLLSPTHLFSSNFRITSDKDSFHLQGKGWGHGVGLCQTGAARMAFEGQSAEEILKFYYPGASLLKIY